MTFRTYSPSQPLPPGRPPMGWQHHRGDGDAIAHARGWLAHVEAGRIGNNPPTPPEVAANRARNEEVLRGFSR